VGDVDLHEPRAAGEASRLAERLRRRPRRRGVSDLDLTPRAINGLLELPLRLEAAWLGSGYRLPAGLSLLAVLRHGPGQ
jgi:hypothetical protein